MPQAGSVETQVTVSAEATSVNMESGSLSSTVTERKIQDVPLVNRSVLDLALTLPNVSGDAGSEDPVITQRDPVSGATELSAGRPMSTLMMADGTNNTAVEFSPRD